MRFPNPRLDFIGVIASAFMLVIVATFISRFYRGRQTLLETVVFVGIFLALAVFYISRSVNGGESSFSQKDEQNEKDEES